MNNGAGHGKTAEALQSFVKNVAGIEVGDDEDVGLTSQGARWSLLGGDFGAGSGVELHFAVDEPIGVVSANLLDDGGDFVEVGVLAAGAVGGVGKHGDFGLLVEINFVSSGGVLYDSVELLFARLLVDTAVGEGKVGAVFALTDKTAREKWRL